MVQVTLSLEKNPSASVTFDVTVNSLFTVSLLNVTSIGLAEPKMPVEPVAETAMRMFLPVRFWAITFTCALSDWKFRFNLLMLGWLSWFVWLKFTG